MKCQRCSLLEAQEGVFCRLCQVAVDDQIAGIVGGQGRSDTSASRDASTATSLLKGLLAVFVIIVAVACAGCGASENVAGMSENEHKSARKDDLIGKGEVVFFGRADGDDIYVLAVETKDGTLYVVNGNAATFAPKKP